LLKIKKILWPTDFSFASYEALKMAYDLAVHFNAELYALHVVSEIPALDIATGIPADTFAPVSQYSSFNIAGYKEELDRMANEKLTAALKEKIANKTAIHTIVKHGDAASEIVRFADEECIDLIVIATHGKTGFKHFLFGSVAEKVVRIPSCPVMTIRVKNEDNAS
jgi:nucleotide-binding universal stress UspA family protein